MFACESSPKKLQMKMLFIYILLIWSMAFSNKVSVEILDCNFSDGFYRQASIRYTSKLIKTTVQLVTGVNNSCHIGSVTLSCRNFKKLQKLKSAF